MSNNSPLVFLLLIVFVNFSDSQFFKAKYNHVPSNLPEAELPSILSNIDINDFKELLAPILVERVPNTEGHANVKNFIMKSMLDAGWSVERDVFVDNTPYGPLNFTNIVAKLNPDAHRFLVIAAHYDSKWFAEGKFVGATDSAVPCAMMLYMAQTLKERLKGLNSPDLSLMFVFFDGEEAFYQWSDTDSLYGARHLAKIWSSSPYPPSSESTNELHRIDVLILLDLIGAANPNFYSYFRNTHPHYQRLVRIEEKLTKLNLIHRKNKRVRYFKEKSSYADIQDDHIPFIQRGVGTIHLITSPFPDVWHTADDNFEHLDFDSIFDLISVLNIFTLEYLQVEPTNKPLSTDQSSVSSGSLFLLATTFAITIIVLLFTADYERSYHNAIDLMIKYGLFL